MSMNRRVAAGLLVGFAIAASVAVLFKAEGPASEAPKQSSKETVGSGSSVAFPFGASSRDTAVGRDSSSSVGAREVYLREASKAKVFEILSARPDPEAKYFAYRAAADCLVLLGDISDKNDLVFRLSEKLPTTAHDRALDSKRKQAVKSLVDVCGGFLRPTMFPNQAMDVLLLESATAGFPAAVIAVEWRKKQEVMAKDFKPVDWSGVVSSVVSSRDSFALLEGEGAILQARHKRPIAGLGRDDIETLLAALKLAQCQVEPQCFMYSLYAAVACASEGKCFDDVNAYFLATLPADRREKAVKAAAVIVEALQQGNPTSLFSGDGK